MFQKFFVIAFDSVQLRQFLADLPSAASKLSSDCYHCVCFHRSHSLHQAQKLSE